MHCFICGAVTVATNLARRAQLDWAIPEAQRLNVKFDATQADQFAHDVQWFIVVQVASNRRWISGSEMDRPGFQALLKDVESNPKISHIITHRRDRFARPEDALRMATLERDIRVKGITFAFSNGIAGPADPSNPNLVDILTLVIEYYQNGDELRKIATAFSKLNGDPPMTAIQPAGMPRMDLCESWLTVQVTKSKSSSRADEFGKPVVMSGGKQRTKARFRSGFSSWT